MKRYYLEFYLDRALQSLCARRNSLILTHLDSGIDDPVQRFILARSLPLHVTSAFEDQFFKGQMTVDTSHQLRRVNKLTFQVGRRLCPLRIPSLSLLSLFSLPHLSLLSVPFFLPCLLVSCISLFWGEGFHLFFYVSFSPALFFFSLLFIVFKKITDVSWKSNCNCDGGLVEETIES